MSKSSKNLIFCICQKSWIELLIFFCWNAINYWITEFFQESLVKHRTISVNLVTSQVVRGMEVAWSFCSLSRLCYQLPGGRFYETDFRIASAARELFFFESACTAASGTRETIGVEANAKRKSKISSTHFDTTTKWNESWTMMMRWENNNL